MVKFFMIVIFSPPEIGSHFLNFMVDSGQDSEARHCINGNSLNNNFDQHFSASFREKTIFPSIYLFGNPISQVAELDSLAVNREGREAKIQLMAMAFF